MNAFPNADNQNIEKQHGNSLTSSYTQHDEAFSVDNNHDFTPLSIYVSLAFSPFVPPHTTEYLGEDESQANTRPDTPIPS